MFDYKQILLDAFGGQLSILTESNQCVVVRIQENTFGESGIKGLGFLWQQLCYQILRHDVFTPPVEKLLAPKEDSETPPTITE